MGTPEQAPTWRERLERLPGLRPAYRALRGAGGKVRDAASDTYWHVRGALPIAPKAKGRVPELWSESAAGLDPAVERRTEGWVAGRFLVLRQRRPDGQLAEPGEDDI
jgi:hypothetical protein